MKRFILSWSVIGLLSMYVTYKSYQEKQSVQEKLTYYEKCIKLKNKKLMHYQKINEQILNEKLTAENKSIELIRQLKPVLKETPCADTPVPDPIANKLHNRVLQIRQSTDNACQSTY